MKEVNQNSEKSLENNSKAKTDPHEEKYRLLFNTLSAGILVQEVVYNNEKEPVDAIFIEANDAYRDHTGIEKEKIIGKRMSEVFPNFKRSLFTKLANVVQTGRSFSSVEYVPQFNRYLDIAAHKLDETKYVTMFSDVTEIFKAQEEIKKNEEKFRSLFSHMIMGICLCRFNDKPVQSHEDPVIFEVNPAFEKIIDDNGSKICGKTLTESIEFIDDQTQQAIFSSLENKQASEIRLYWKEKDKHLNLKAFPLSDLEFALLVQDVTIIRKENMARYHLSAIIESSEDAVYSVSLDGKILTWNHGAQNLYGYNAKEAIGKSIKMLSFEDKKSEHDVLINLLKEGKKIINLELDQKRKDGSPVPVYLTKSPVLNENGEIIAISDIVKDLTKVKEREQKLILAEKKAKESGALKTAFLQNVSHEIRTPMNSILGFSDILRSRVSGQNLKYLQVIDQSGKQLLRLLDDVMDVSRIEAGELVIDKSSFNLHKLLRSVRDQFEGVIIASKKENLDLILTIDEKDRARMLHTDKYRLNQILSNLLSNAIKYTEKGKVEFGYELTDPELLFFVKDTGQGIETAYQHGIFDRFNRSDPQTEKLFSGTGLGLTISKALTELLGGKIWFESEPGKGSDFYFTIPNESVTQEEAETLHISHNTNILAPDLTGKRILVAEDDIYSLEMIKLLLSDTGAEIVTAIDGDEAVHMIMKNHLDLVLLDIRLPGKNGFEVVREIREKHKNLPVIAQTAYALPEERKKTLESGFNEHINKPINQNVLYALLKQFLS